MEGSTSVRPYQMHLALCARLNLSRKSLAQHGGRLRRHYLENFFR